jgi:AcrR family transcriptional regulator
MQVRIRQVGSSSIRLRIVQAAVRLHSEIGFRKTTVADIARTASMSPANVYRFFPSRQAIEEAVVADLFEPIAAAVRENWAVALSYAERIWGLLRGIIAAGQASGELRQGSPMAMTCCLLEAMDGYLNPSRIDAATVRPTFDEMMDFCVGALRHPALDQSVDLVADLCPKSVAQG